MKIPQYKFDKGISLINLGDVHFANKYHNIGLFKKAIDYVLENDAYWYSTGDMRECKTPGSVGSVSDVRMTIEDEYYEIQKKLDPIKDRCLGLVSSNHSMRVIKQTGMNDDKKLCHALGIPYLGNSSVIKITCDRLSYFMCIHHGTGGGVSETAPIMACKKLNAIYPGCDIYSVGHFHKFETLSKNKFYIDKKRNTISEQEAWYVSTAHCMDWKHGYGEEKLLEPSTPGFSIIKLNANPSGNNSRKRIEVGLFR